MRWRPFWLAMAFFFVGWGWWQVLGQKRGGRRERLALWAATILTLMSALLWALGRNF
ncbi:MAG: hypothetical protein ACK40X_09810 [Armatimonadota bacterium]